jgi:hypothetical protein
MHFKDSILDALADRANVAQFVSFSPELEQRYARVRGFEANHRFPTLQTALRAILEQASGRSINIRSFDPASPKSREFIYGLRSVDEAEHAIRRLASETLYTIVNETIDVHDGGVSGVLLGHIIEFAPEDTPRCVEKPGTAALPRDLGMELLRIVYGFKPALDYDLQTRVEFSLHPLRRGVRNDHTIIWELEDVEEWSGHADIRWPNRFSEFIGDKAYGLLIASLFSLPVPDTLVISRSIRPFRFGRDTECAETWIRTAPRVQQPGRYTTHRGWLDPYKLMNSEDPTGEFLASVLAQAGIDAKYSGAAILSEGVNDALGELTIEGTAGFGDEFMVGRKKRTTVPAHIIEQIKRIYVEVSNLGPVRFEWVADDRGIWIVQFHRGASPSLGRVIFPGEPRAYHRFDVELGLEALRPLIQKLEDSGEGIILVGDVGVTSHFGDVLRRAKIPSYIEESGTTAGSESPRYIQARAL